MYESGEMYLETIYFLQKEISNVRSLDVAEYMGYSKPSVSRAVGILKKDGFIETDENGFLILTKKGKEVAEKTAERHNTLSDIFKKLGVSEEVATKDACRIEHVISDETFDALKKHLADYS
ncbi:MAG: metal-dependent transcriptional regulator [Acutalibacteraceae bacterium]